jgi:RNA polymerase sigma factor (sigma-70 family)
MMTAEHPCTAEPSDAELVAESLAGGREAFCQIVERHQTLVCSLAYCATGSLTQSEDLAQETFLAAWRQLAELREPSKLRPWLCGIARFVIGKELRRQGREPDHAAETLETVNELAALEPLPSDRAISKEEQAILWHCVARVPEIYREPLVLFYRENQSIERVAEALELSGDAVKQRLARGRKLLQEQALAYVEGALQGTKPGHAFTVGVLAALPLSATSAKAVATGAAVKGSSTAKTVAGLAALGAMLLFYSMLGFLAFAGGCAGYWMSRACARSARQCESGILFWRALAAGFVVCFFTRRWLWTSYLRYGRAGHSVWFLWMSCLHLFYLVIVAALAIWVHRWWRESSTQKTDAQEIPRWLKRRFVLWLSLGMIGPACLLVPIIGPVLWHEFGPPTEQHLSDAEVQKIMTEREDAYFQVSDMDGMKTLYVTLPENNPGSLTWRASHMPAWWKHWVAGTKPSWWNLWNDGTAPTWLIDAIAWTGWRPLQMSAMDSKSAVKMLDEKGVHYGTGHGSARGVAVEAWPFGSILPFFIVPMGIMIILRQLGNGQWAKSAAGHSEKPAQEDKHGRMLLALQTDPRARKIFGIAFVTAFLLVFSANAFAVRNAFTARGLYIMLFLGSVKGAFLGLVAGICVSYLRTHRKVSKARVKI